MAFANKIGNLVKQAIASNPSVYQAVRCMSSSKLFVGGLSYSTDDHSLREAFADHGEVIEARVIMDRETGRSRGFGFVSFTSVDDASAAITAMDGKDLHGRMVRVNYATDRTGGFRSGGGGGYGGGGFGGGGYGGGGYGGNGGYSGGGYGGSSGGGYGGDSYGSGGSGGGYGGSGSGGNYGGSGSGGNYSVAGGGGGSDSYVGGAATDNYASSGTAGGYGGSGSVGYGSGGGDQHSSNPSTAGYSNQDDLLEGNDRVDNNDDGYANKQG